MKRTKHLNRGIQVDSETVDKSVNPLWILLIMFLTWILSSCYLFVRVPRQAQKLINHQIVTVFPGWKAIAFVGFVSVTFYLLGLILVIFIMKVLDPNYEVDTFRDVIKRPQLLCEVIVLASTIIILFGLWYDKSSWSLRLFLSGITYLVFSFLARIMNLGLSLPKGKRSGFFIGLFGVVFAVAAIL